MRGEIGREVKGEDAPVEGFLCWFRLMIGRFKGFAMLSSRAYGVTMRF